MQFGLERCVVEGAPEALGDEQFVRLLARFCNDFDGLRQRRRTVRVDHRYVHNELTKVVQVNTDPNHGSSFRAKGFSQVCGAPNHFVKRSRLHRQRVRPYWTSIITSAVLLACRLKSLMKHSPVLKNPFPVLKNSFPVLKNSFPVLKNSFPVLKSF